MKVLVDTCIWSLSLRRKKITTTTEDLIVAHLAELINEFRIQMIGPIRQELLSGIVHREHFEKLQKHLQAFDDLPIATEDYERAAEMYNVCRKKGISGSHVDFLICSMAVKNQLSIFTTDQDFYNYAKYLSFQLYEASSK